MSTGVYRDDEQMVGRQVAEMDQEVADRQRGLVELDREQRQQYLHDFWVAISGVHKSDQ